MKKLVVLLFLLSYSQFSNGAEFRNGVGLGVQYGGMGWQGGVGLGKHNIKLSLGAPAISLGYEYAAKSKWSFGTHHGVITFFGLYTEIVLSVHANYHFSEFDSSGWVVGLDLVRIEPKLDIDDREIPGKTGHFPFVSVGYKF